MPQASLLTYFSTSSRNAFRSTSATHITDQSRNSLSSSTDIRAENLLPSVPEAEATTSIHVNAPNHQPTSLDAPVGSKIAPPSEHKSSQLVIADVQVDHLPALQRLTTALLPIRYPDTFFTETVQQNNPCALARVALIEGKPVGWIRCRLDQVPGPRTQYQLYVQALCLLALHRGHGLATALLESVCEAVTQTPHKAECVCAHVWESNEDALEWYEKRGFRKLMLIDAYYRKLRPAGAWFMRKDLP